jgi:tRNA-splicing ligase RtcB
MINLNKISEFVWEVPKKYRKDMRVPVRIFASEKLLEKIREDKSIEQAINVATLPGIQKFAFAMPDIHEGYGFPIGGVAAFDVKEGIISPGGIGYDINCGVRLLKSRSTIAELRPRLQKLADELFENIPSGVGRGGKIRLSDVELDDILASGSEWMQKKGFAEEDDIFHTEENGRMRVADPAKISQRAKNRGREQIGTLGSGNHFEEVQVVEKIFDKKIAEVFGLWEGQITIAIHCGSRGLGHQHATDYLNVMREAMKKYNIIVSDPELACTLFESPEGAGYFAGMAAAANFAFANRQYLTYLTRESWSKIMKGAIDDLSLTLLYDVAHNIGKLEEHKIGGKKKLLVMHRKGATRAFGPARKEIPKEFHLVGQPVLLPGNMGIASYVMAGLDSSEEMSFGSAAHGAGRAMSRVQAKRTWWGTTLKEELEKQGIYLRTESMAGAAEEAPGAYKDIDEVARVTEAVGLAKRVARLKPLAVIKG